MILCFPTVTPKIFAGSCSVRANARVTLSLLIIFTSVAEDDKIDGEVCENSCWSRL